MFSFFARPCSLVMMSWMAEASGLEERVPALEEALGSRIRTNFIMNKNYRGHILEVVAPDSGKWPALRQIAADASIEPHEIAAIGDDNNDVEMLRNVGLGIAMGNAVPAALEAAEHIAPSNEEDGAAAAIERWVLDAVD